MMVRMRTIAAIVTLACAGAAWADDEPTANVEDLFDQGRALLAQGKPAEACTKFEAALKADADAAGVMLNLGVCNAQQDKTATALKWFRKAQVRGNEMQLVETEAAAKEQSVLLAAKVPTLRLSFKTPPRLKATVTIDGTTIEETTFARVEIDPGHHVLVVTTLEGTTTQDIDIHDGENQSPVLEVPAPKTRIVMVDLGSDQRKHAVRIGEISAGLGVAVLAYCTYEAIHLGKPGLSLDDYENGKEEVRYIGTIAGTVALTGLGYAAWKYVHAPGKERREQIIPTVGPTGAGVSVLTTF
jgi:hypothetical protein